MFLGLSRAVPGKTSARGFLTPRMPPEWLPREVADAVDAFPDRFQDLVGSHGEAVENRNLETGLLEDEPADHPNTERIRETLASLRVREGSREAVGKEA